jgi:hypothetical protein
MSEATQPGDLLRQLDDIRGLGHIAWWPLAPGWWVLIAIIVLSVAVTILVYLRRRAWRSSWKGEAAFLLINLEKNLTVDNAQKTAAFLSVTLRRIAMRCFSRTECAGLQGATWLQWLRTHDPDHFNWPDAGSILIEAPYAPPNHAVKPEKVTPLIHAARKWVR